MEDFLEEEYDEENFENKYNASNTWISKFKKRHVFSRRKFHKKRRSYTKFEQMIDFLLQIKNILNRSKPNHILNVDETSWLFKEIGEYTWAPTGSDIVSIQL